MPTYVAIARPQVRNKYRGEPTLALRYVSLCCTVCPVNAILMLNSLIIAFLDPDRHYRSKRCLRRATPTLRLANK